MSMQFGVFDHMDRGRGSLAELYESRLQLAEEYDRAIGKAVCPRVDAGVRWGGATQAPFIDMRQRAATKPMTETSAKKNTKTVKAGQAIFALIICHRPGACCARR
jgi:hypothetical protein